MKKTLQTVLAAILCFSLLAGCGGGGQQAASEQPAPEPTSADGADAGQEQEESGEAGESEEDEDFQPTVLDGKLVMGLDDTFAPMGFRDEGNNLVGFDIDLATAVAEELGVEIEFQPIDWNAKEMELKARNVDCLWNGMSYTDERNETMTLSQPYLNNRLIIMSNPDVEINDYADLVGLQVGTQAGSSGLKVIQDHEIYSEIAGDLHEYATYDECILDMQAGRIDAMVVDEVLGKYKNNNLETKLNVAAVDFGDDLYVIGFRKGDDALCAQVEDAIKAVIASGKGAEISVKWLDEDLLLELR